MSVSKRRSGFGRVRAWRSRGPLGVVLAAVVLTGVVQAVPAQAAPVDSALPQSVAERASDDAVPVPSGPVVKPSADPARPELPSSVTLTPEQSQAVEDLKAQTDALAKASKS